jgi:uncharacterized protein YgfB (UPF0149 family)
MSVQSRILPDFDTVDQVLRKAGAAVEAAEAQGAFCGAVAILGPHAEPAWIAETLESSNSDNALTAECAQVLSQVARVSYAWLEEGDLSLRLLLPDDEESMEMRVHSLAAWCQGFMHSLAVAGAEDKGDANSGPRSEISREILKDFSEITKATALDDENEMDEEEAEASYLELVEFVRVSVQLIYEEGVPLRPSEDQVN